jgi:circadian clock protein KaiC
MAVVEPNKNLPKCPSGVRGLDEITFGGLPNGRPTLLSGSAGSGKTLLAMEFLVHGAAVYGEPGVFMAFEETAEELTQNCASLGFHLKELIADGKVVVDHVRVERSEIEETGEYDLEGLFIRLNHAIDSVSAKRVVLDTIESLFSGLSNEGILRAELRRLFRWLKDKGVTAIITGERGEKSLTRYGLEEYVSDCVILLDHRVDEQISTRRLRVVKYRGSLHGTNEYPFIIDEHGISIIPITSVKLDYDVSSERISTGIPKLDEMFGGKGYYRGSTVLISGTAGSGKTSIACHFADSACKRGEHCIFFAFEESPRQVIRNMRSVGIDLEPWVGKGFLQIHSLLSTFYGLERHLVRMEKIIKDFDPSVAIIDPASTLINVGVAADVKSLFTRLIDDLKNRHVTQLFTNLAAACEPMSMQTAISSLVDTWILLQNLDVDGDFKRSICVLKSRGMVHSSRIREFSLTDRGVEIA